MKRPAAVALVLAAFLTGCAHAPDRDLSGFKTANPASILVVPPVNESVELTAADYFLSTVSVPLAERGYYVFPANLVKRVLEDEGLSDASLVHAAPAVKLCQMFGADSVLYVTIKEWDAKYLVLSTVVNVGLEYTIKDCKNGDTIWRHGQRMTYSPQHNSVGNPLADLLVMAVSAAITKASPNYVPLAQQANALAFLRKGGGIPPGPYARPEGR